MRDYVEMHAVPLKDPAQLVVVRVGDGMIRKRLRRSTLSVGSLSAALSWIRVPHQLDR